jgi:hypothetical protein
VRPVAVVRDRLRNDRALLAKDLDQVQVRRLVRQVPDENSPRVALIIGFLGWALRCHPAEKIV